MPTGVIGIENLDDGIRVTLTNGRVWTVTSATLPAAVKNGTTVDAETWVNNWFVSRNYNARCKITSLVPLVVNLVVADPHIDLSNYRFD